MANTLQLVVTGTGRCGTGFMSQVITKAGLQCGHEAYFGPLGPNWDPRIPADSSWMAVPYLSALGPELPVVLVYRDPLAVAESLAGIRFFETPSTYLTFLMRKNQRLKTVPMAVRGFHHYADWNARALPYAHLVMNIDSPDWTALGELIDIEPIKLANAAADVGVAYNARRRAPIEPRFMTAEALEIYHQMEEVHHAR